MTTQYLTREIQEDANKTKVFATLSMRIRQKHVIQSLVDIGPTYVQQLSFVIHLHQMLVIK